MIVLCVIRKRSCSLIASIWTHYYSLIVSLWCNVTPNYSLALFIICIKSIQFKCWFFQGEIDEPGNDRIFHIFLCWRIIQTKNKKCNSSPATSWENWRTCSMNNSFCFCVKTVRLGMRTSRIFVAGWLLGEYLGFAPALDFRLVNTIPRKIIWVFSLQLNCFQRCRLQQG